MTRIIPDVQILDQDGQWQSAIAGLMSCQIDGGLSTGASKPGIGRCELVWDNSGQGYNPDPAGDPAALLRARRRIRVTAAGGDLGYCGRAIHDGAADLAYWSQVVTTPVTAGDTWTLAWEARAASDSACNTDQVYLVTSSESQPPVTVAYTNRWLAYTRVFTVSANATTIEPRFRPHFAGTGKNSAAVEYRNITLRRGGGANVLSNGDFSGSGIAPWTHTDVGGSTVALAVIPDYRVLFNGKINRIEPAPFQPAGAKTCKVIAVDFVDALQRTKVAGLALQKDRRGDQLVASALSGITLPGKLLDVGRQTFSRAFDGYTRSTALYDVLTDCALSEYSLWWVDPDGTLRWAARDYAPKRIAAGVRLALAGGPSNTMGQPFNMRVTQDAAAVINKTVITWHPRWTQLGTVILGQITSAVRIPPIQADGSPGTHTVTLTFRDPTTQKICGGDSLITPLIPGIDYRVTDTADGTGFDYTASAVFAIEIVSVEASQITLMLKNTATGNLYANKLQVRGNAVVAYDPQTVTCKDAAAIAADDESAWSKDLPFNDDGNFVTALGQYLVGRFKTPFDAVEWVSVDWCAALGGVNVLAIAPMDVLAISDVQVGMTTPLKHLVIHWSYRFTAQGADSAGYLGNVTWALERADDSTYLILDDPGYGKLDGGSRLFI